MTSEYGYKLNPHRKLRKQKGIKGMRRTLFNNMYRAQLTKVVF